VEVTRTRLPKDTLEALRSQKFDLVLINRKLDEDYSDGLEILQTIKADPTLNSVPVMLVTNYEEHQKASVTAGGEYGFGKLEYDKPETRERLAKFLE
jgi:two-component system chemotaxis response regulator CheY